MSQLFQDVSPSVFEQYMRKRSDTDYLLVDVREPREYEQSHIPGAQLLPLGQLEARLSHFPPDRDLIFACRSGARSRVAALMAADKMAEHGPIFNLDGGLLAWQGHTVTDFPQVKLLLLEHGMQQTLLAAMDLEKGAWNFYRHVLERYPNAPMARTIEYLSLAESAHAEALYVFWVEAEENPPEFEDLFAGLSGDILEGGMPFSEAVDRLESAMLPFDLAVFELALDIEYAAYDLYRSAAETTEIKSLKKLFLDIGEGEKRHMASIVKSLHKAF
ncbi:MAG: sulfurtransferase [Desulfobacterales bacterium]|nr:sulfurtransferase [Desulfobacterales bacterium]